MKTIFTNATVMWDELEIERRDQYVRQIVLILTESWQRLNQSVKFRRVETPILTPDKYLVSHDAAGFPLVGTGLAGIVLRPETTAGTLEAFLNMNVPKKMLPMCVWQHGKSFRNEANSETMRASKLRLREFWQLEFQLICSEGTKAPYLAEAIDSLIDNFGGEKVVVDDLPHYSRMTLDWEIKGIEVASLSHRSDFEGYELFEVAIGTDRLINLLGDRT